jgi:regulatory protein
MDYGCFLFGIVTGILGMPSGVITALDIQKRNKKRVNVYLNEEYAFSLPLDEAAKLRKGQSLSEADVSALQSEDEVLRAVDRGANFLSFRPRSVHEVRKNLVDKETPPQVIDAALLRLEALGYLDDRAFAQFWINQRNQFKPLSPRALKHELRQKGIAAAIIDEVLAEVDADDSAYRAAQSQVRKLRGHDQRAFRDKLLAFLARRGFSYGDSKTAVARLIETLEAEESYFAVGEAPDDLYLSEADE